MGELRILPALALAAILLALAPSPSPTGERWTCSPESIHREVTAGEPTEVSHVAAIPRDVIRAIGLTGVRLANPGETWNAGCVQDGVSPSSTLVYAARSSNLWVVYTKHGGEFTRESQVILCRDGRGDHLYQINLPPAWSLQEMVATKRLVATHAALRQSLQPGWIVARRSLPPSPPAARSGHAAGTLPGRAATAPR